MKNKYIAVSILLIILILALGADYSFADDITIPSVSINIDGNEDGNLSGTVLILIVITLLTLLPTILLMMTSFTRFIIVFSFLRKAISLQTTPSNQVLIALSLFMTIFVMMPVFTDVYNNAYEPLNNGEITQEEAIDNAIEPFKDFMLRQVRSKDLALFVELTDEQYDDVYDIPITTIIPAFLISEVKTAFQIGFLLFIPFIVIDMVVASTLMSLGMMMLPPVMISLPFKLLLFIMVDGWHLLVGQLLTSIK